MNRKTMRQALAEQTPLISPLAHDGLSARMIELAGFKSFNIGGSALLAARHAYPDIGLIGLQDMVSGIRDIANATSLPFMADADDGYGDVKSVFRTVRAYEQIGVGAFLIEDQDRDRKQQRADKAAAVCDEAVIQAKLRAVQDARASKETLVIGRTDAYGALGLDAALRRAAGFVELGVEGIFIAGLRTEGDYERVGKTFRGITLLSAAMFEGGDTPWLSPAVLGEMGFNQISFPISLMLRVVEGLREGLAALRAHGDGHTFLHPFAQAKQARQALDEAVDVKGWREIEGNYTAKS